MTEQSAKAAFNATQRYTRRKFETGDPEVSGGYQFHNWETLPDNLKELWFEIAAAVIATQSDSAGDAREFKEMYGRKSSSPLST